MAVCPLFDGQGEAITNYTLPEFQDIGIYTYV